MEVRLKKEPEAVHAIDRDVEKYLREPQRQLLASFGLQKGGNANHFCKELPITSVSEAEAAAGETLRIFFDVFGFRGQWPAETQTVADGRASGLPVLRSLTPEDFAELVVDARCVATVVQSESGPFILFERGRHRFVARMVGQVPKQNLYSAVRLMATIAPKDALTSDRGD
jgi:hypothetical protein